MKATCSSETSTDFQWTSRRNIPEDGILQKILLLAQSGRNVKHHLTASEDIKSTPFHGVVVTNKDNMADFVSPNS
jgi:hypothetical protein